jgi:outer membrane protein, heavy metal efflux system
MRNKLSVAIFIIALSSNLYSQDITRDTVKINLIQADSLFIGQNLTLLAERCHIDAARALVIQARLFSNPTISGNQNIINTGYKTNGGRKWFDFTNYGETTFQIQKLFLLAGKHNKQIQAAELSANREEQNYYDLLRTLKYSLRSSFYNIYFIQQNIRVFDKEIASLGRLIEVCQDEYKKGFLSKKELLRLQSTLFSLENEKLDFSTQLISSLTDFNILMHSSDVYYIPMPDTTALDLISPENLELQSLLSKAHEYRDDLKMAETDLHINELNLAYQKALAVPDMTLSTGWDRNGSFIHNYNYIGLQIDLPVFNRNQGNIKSARFNLESSRFQLQHAEEQVSSDVINAYSKAIEANRLYKKFDNKFVAELEEMNTEMIKNYEKRNISLIEFLDYYDAYKENAIQLNNLRYNRINAFEKLNFSVGEGII